MSDNSLTIQPNSLSRSGSSIMASFKSPNDVLTGTTSAYVLSGSDALTSVQSTLDALTGDPQADVLSRAGIDSVVASSIHKILHGTGNAGIIGYNSSTGQGVWWMDGLPSIYDRYAYYGSGQSILNTSFFPNPSLALGYQLTSNNLFFAGPNAVAGNRGAWPKLYVPSQWQQGSSYSHLDEGTYPRGNPNSLDTPSFSYGEAQHSVGPII